MGEGSGYTRAEIDEWVQAQLAPPEERLETVAELGARLIAQAREGIDKYEQMRWERDHQPPNDARHRTRRGDVTDSSELKQS